jgi:hypothetical protein
MYITDTHMHPPKLTQMTHVQNICEKGVWISLKLEIANYCYNSDHFLINVRKLEKGLQLCHIYKALLLAMNFNTSL